MRIVEYIPHFLREILEFQNISDVETSEIQRLKEKIDFVLKNQFISTADSYGLSRLESYVETFAGANDDLETRRKKLLLMTSENRPYTVKSLKSLLENVFGKSKFELSIDGFELTVKLAPTFDSDEIMLENYLKKVLPANVYFRITDGEEVPEVEKHDTYDELTEFTYTQLASFTYEELEGGI